MIPTPPVSETIHATCITIDGLGVLLMGRSGSGKSDLALRLLDRGARLVSDDYTILRRVRNELVATAPPSIAGKLEVRGVGILDWDTDPQATIALCVALDEPVERLPDTDGTVRPFAGVHVPIMSVSAVEASAVLKVELAARMQKQTPGLSG